MECQNETPRLAVELEDAIYEIEFGQIQIEVTGLCNMRCLHCRAERDTTYGQDMPINQIIKIIRFARQFSPNYKEIVISGGEPLAHRDFSSVLRAVRHHGGEFVTLTTNGSLLTCKHLDEIRNLQFSRFTLSVSLDSVYPEKHDAFRQHQGAFKKATQALRMIAENGTPGLIASMRSTIQPDQIGEMEELALLAQQIGCGRISFSAIHPAGRARDCASLWMTMDQKRLFLERVYALKKQFPDMNVTTNDPLKCLLRGTHDIGGEDELVFDGCVAGAISFNVNADGTMTPCALLNIPMMQVFPLSIEEMTEQYRQNKIVQDILSMNLKGKCGSCHLKYQCGGCRVRAHAFSGDVLETDPHCWL